LLSQSPGNGIFELAIVDKPIYCSNFDFICHTFEDKSISGFGGHIIALLSIVGNFFERSVVENVSSETLYLMNANYFCVLTPHVIIS